MYYMYSYLRFQSVFNANSTSTKTLALGYYFLSWCYFAYVSGEDSGESTHMPESLLLADAIGTKMSCAGKFSCDGQTYHLMMN